VSQLSIITVNLNNNPGLRRTMESVLHQKYTEYEYVVVDGGSEDGSVQSIREVENSFAGNFQWTSEPDSGIYEAMNKGIRMAKGEYLLFLNSGDFLVNSMVLEDVFSSSHTADFLLGRCHVSENGSVIRTANPPQKITFGYLYHNALAHQSTFIKRDLFEKYGYYREDFRFNSDVEFWYRTIVLQNCTTETLGTIISDYNTDGITAKLADSKEYQREMAEIYAHPHLQLFIPDYDAWAKERQENQVLYWAKSKKYMNFLLQSAYRFARWFAKIRR